MKKVLLLIFSFIVCLANAQKTTTKQMTADDGFVWVLISDGKHEGAQDSNGNLLIPLERGYNNLFYSLGDFLFSKEDVSGYGLCNKAGKEIIPAKNGIKGICAGPNNRYHGFNDKYLVIVVYDVTGREIIPSGIYDEIYAMEGDYPFFYRILKDSHVGVANMDGREIIPPIFSDVLLPDAQGNFTVKKDTIYGLYSSGGQVLVPLSRGYTGCYYDKRDGYYSIYKGKFRGICDANGVEIISPIYDYCNYDRNLKEFAVAENGVPKTIRKNLPSPKQSSNNTEITSTATRVSTSVTDMFQQAYDLPNTEVQKKFELYSQILKDDPNNREGLNSRVYNNIGVLYEQTNDLQNAQACYEKALHISTSNTQAYNNLKRVKRANRLAKFNNAMNALNNFGQGLSTIGGGAATTTGDVSIESSISNKQAVTSLEEKAAKTKRDAYLTPLRDRESNAYSDYISLLLNMKLYPQKYDDSQRRKIQATMKQIRTKWEQKGFKFQHSEWEDWDGR